MNDELDRSQIERPVMAELDDPRIPLAQDRTDLAYDRSCWASERTLMAWIRTCLSMISFGFAIDKVFGSLQQEFNRIHLGPGYHLLGVALVVVGILLLVLASVEHVIILKRLSSRYGTRASLKPRWSLPLFGATVMLVIGLAALVLILEPAGQ